MKNTNLTIKPCKHEGCSRPFKFGKGGYCGLHEAEDAGYDRKQAKDRIKKTTIKHERKKNTAEPLQEWYANAAAALYLNPFCQECGARISPVYYGASTCHVLPKKIKYGFPSVATHPDNLLFLGAECGCHTKYDSSWAAAAKMAVWPMALEKIKAMYDFIDEGELKNLPYLVNG